MLPKDHSNDATAALIGDVSRRTMREVIAEKLAALIGSGVLSVGDDLPGEREIAATLSVSRETVRGAIQILASHGIVQVSQGARTTVAKSDLGALAVQVPGHRGVSNYDLEPVHAARLLIERRVVADAARVMSAHTLQLLRKSLDVQEECVNDPVRFLLCDREFHTLVYRSCGNLLLADIAIDLYNYLLEHRRRIVARPGSIAASISDHRVIIEALEQCDSDAAAAAFGHHEMRIYLTTRDFLSATTES